MAEIERLVTVWDARFDKFEEKLNKAVRATYGAAGKIEKRLDSTNDNFARKLGAGFGKQIQSDLDGLASRAGRAKTALSGLGVAGLGVAAGFGAIAASVNQAVDAMNFGDELQTAADKLQITSEALQELQFVADETDVPIAELRDGLFKLNGALGAFRTGVGGKRVESVFAALGLSRDDLKDVKDASDLLPILADRLGRVSSTAEQVQLARKLGIENLLPILRQGSDGIAELSARASELGLVLSNETVKGLAEADRQMERASQQIQTTLRAAFSGLATDVAAVTTELAKFLLKIREIEEKSPRIGRILQELRGTPGPAFVPFAVAKGLKTPNISQPSFEQLSAQMDATFGRKPGFEPTFQGGGSSGAANHDADKRRQRERELAQQINKVQADILATSIHSSAAIDDRLQVEYSRLEAERAIRDEEIKQLEADYKRTKGLEGLSESEAEQLRALEDQLLAQRRNNARLDALREQRKVLLEQERDLAAFSSEQLQAAEGLATTQAERRRIQLRLLELEREQERKALEARLLSDPDVTDAQRQAQLSAFDTSTEARRGSILAGTRGPLEELRHSLPQTAEEINEAIEAITARGLQSLEDGLLAVVQGTQDMGDAFRQVANQIIADLARIAIQQAIIGPLDNLLSGGLGGIGRGLGRLFGGGRATGGPVTAGMAYRINEQNAEWFVPHVSGSILNQQQMRVASRGGPTTVMVQPIIHLHAEGAVMTDKLLASFEQRANQAAARAGIAAVQTSLRGTAPALAKYNQLKG